MTAILDSGPELCPAGSAQAGVATFTERRIQDVRMDSVDPRSNEELLRVAHHDSDALAELYGRVVDRTVAFAVRRCANPEQVHDLVAATWLEVISVSPRFDPARGRAVPWILGVMANLANDQRRRSAREHEALRRLAGQRVMAPDDVERIEAAIDAARLGEGIRDQMNALSPREREAFELVALAGVGQEQAANALGVAPAAFRMRLARARRRLRAVLEDDNYVEVVGYDQNC